MHFLFYTLFLSIFFLTPSTSFAQDNTETLNPNLDVTESEAYDPWEGMNRGIFWFNERFDQNLFGPVAHGYDYITPTFLQTGFTNFFENLSAPTKFASNVFQAELTDASEVLGRFLINTTIGLLGFIDVASDLGLEPEQEDFGKVFASWGIGEGPYLVLPLMGPSIVRNAVGQVFNILTSPSFLIQQTDLSSDIKFWWPLTTNALELINLRNNLDDAINTGRTGALDYYLFQQSSYYQFRRAMESGKNAEYMKSSENPQNSVEDDLDKILLSEGK
jgi:phospholipid-binding lipoprotein MlaA